jgi:hypothetical protein
MLITGGIVAAIGLLYVIYFVSQQGATSGAQAAVNNAVGSATIGSQVGLSAVTGLPL